MAPFLQFVPSLPETEMNDFVEQAIQERANLGHLYEIQDGEDGPEAYFTALAAASIWRAVKGAVERAGWRIDRDTPKLR